MYERDRQRLLQIKKHCHKIQTYLDRFGDSADAYWRDEAYRDALAMHVLQIGENANGLTTEFRAATQDQIPWKEIRGMRNVIAHGYASVNFQVIWDTIHNDIPRLRQFCAALLTEN